MARVSSPGFIAYTKEGKEIKFAHKVDWLTAIQGNFLANPPGTPVPAGAPAPAQGEKVKGIDSIIPSASGATVDLTKFTVHELKLKILELQPAEDVEGLKKAELVNMLEAYQKSKK